MVASEKRGARAASPVEMTSGDGAAAILVGEGKPVATLLAKASRTADFVDHFRSLDNQFDYQWEERWIRDAGYMTVVPPVIKRCLEAAKVAAKDVTHFCMPATLARVASSVAKAAGIDDKAICDPLHANCGDTGAAHTLMLLAATLEKAKPGDKILLVGFGQGADALLFEVTPEIAKRPKRSGRRRPSGAPQGGAELRPLPRLQRPDRAGARHALGDRQGDRRSPRCGATARR